MRPRFRVDWPSAAAPLRLEVGSNPFPGNPIARGRPKQFTEGLWRHDVGELFLRHGEIGSRYLEINLAPGGAWWACLFDGYRNVLREGPPFSPDGIEAVLQEDSWTTRLEIPAAFLAQEGFSPDRSRGNVCFILGPAEDRQHFAWARVPTDPPDFHRVEDWVPLEGSI